MQTGTLGAKSDVWCDVHYDAQRVSLAAAEEPSDEGTDNRRLPAVGCNDRLYRLGIGAILWWLKYSNECLFHDESLAYLGQRHRTLVDHHIDVV